MRPPHRLHPYLPVEMQRRGFTLIEIIVVIAVIAILCWQASRDFYVSALSDFGGLEGLARG